MLLSLLTGSRTSLLSCCVFPAFFYFDHYNICILTLLANAVHAGALHTILCHAHCFVIVSLFLSLHTSS